MHALLVTIGTDGDVFPYAGLGERLLARGHHVTLLSSEHYAGLATDFGFDFRAILSNAEADEFLANPDLWHPIKSGLFAARWGVRFIRRQHEVLADVARDPEAILVANPGVVAARLIQDQRLRSVATILLQPALIPSVFEPPVMPRFNLPRGAPRWMWSLYWRLLDAAGYFLVTRDLNRIRVSLGLPPIRRLFQWWLSPELVIGMFPDWYASPQPDWPAQMRLAGFPLFSGRSRAMLSAEVRDFCSKGSPPIAITLGTGMRHGSEFFRAAVEACRVLDKRGILLTKYPHQLPHPLPEFMLHCNFAPFQELFPLCAAVVHHGGVGTTAQALASGTPQLVLPLAWDQADNAHRVTQLQAGSSLGPSRRSARELARALAALMTPELRERCRELSARFKSSDAFEVAAAWLEELSLSKR
jgi:rhamnosyltransferase subunit B